jgi:hypothetical protein
MVFLPAVDLPEQLILILGELDAAHHRMREDRSLLRQGKVLRVDLGGSRREMVFLGKDHTRDTRLGDFGLKGYIWRTFFYRN